MAHAAQFHNASLNRVSWNRLAPILQTRGWRGCKFRRSAAADWFGIATSRLFTPFTNRKIIRGNRRVALVGDPDLRSHTEFGSHSAFQSSVRHLPSEVIMRCFVSHVVLLAVFSGADLVAQSTPPRPQPTRPMGASIDQWNATGQRGMVVAGGAEAVDAGMALFKTGGNAADSAAATIFALSVTDAHQFCFGGEVPILVYDAKRKVVEVLSGMGAAPRLATREHFQKAGGIPASGIESAAVPAALDVCLTLLERFGTKSFEEAVQPALKILDRGEHEWHPQLARTIRRLIEAERGSPHDRSRGLA